MKLNTFLLKLTIISFKQHHKKWIAGKYILIQCFLKEIKSNSLDLVKLEIDNNTFNLPDTNHSKNEHLT